MKKILALVLAFIMSMSSGCLMGDVDSEEPAYDHPSEEEYWESYRFKIVVSGDFDHGDVEFIIPTPVQYFGRSYDRPDGKIQKIIELVEREEALEFFPDFWNHSGDNNTDIKINITNETADPITFYIEDEGTNWSHEEWPGMTVIGWSDRMAQPHQYTSETLQAISYVRVKVPTNDSEYQLEVMFEAESNIWYCDHESGFSVPINNSTMSNYTFNGYRHVKFEYHWLTSFCD